MNDVNVCSGDDPPCVGIVQVIEVHLGRAPRVVYDRSFIFPSYINAVLTCLYTPIAYDYPSSAWFLVLRGAI